MKSLIMSFFDISRINNTIMGVFLQLINPGGVFAFCPKMDMEHGSIFKCLLRIFSFEGSCASHLGELLLLITKTKWPVSSTLTGIFSTYKC